MMQLITRIGTTVLILLPMQFMFENQMSIISIGGVKFSPLLAIVFGILSSAFPSLFNMGVEGWSKASLVPRLQPLLVTLPVIYLLQYIPQTYITAIFASYLAGLSASYIGRLIVPKR